MPSRELIYRVNLGTGDAVRQARFIRASIERELRQINVGQLRLPTFAAAINDAQRLRLEFERAAQAATDIRIPAVGGGTNNRFGSGGGGFADAIISQLPGGIGTLGGAVLGGFAATAVVSGFQEIGGAIDDLGRRGAVFEQLKSVLEDYARSVGTTADAIVDAGKKAAQGTISEYELVLNANRALQFEVAKTPEAFGKLIELSTALGRAQGITDTQALEFLTTGLARESRLILDNLGLIINLETATENYAATLGKSASELTTAERKQALLNEAYIQGATALEANRDAADSAATRYERYDASVQDLKDSFGELLASNASEYVEGLALQVRLLNEALTGETDASTVEQQIKNLTELRDRVAQEKPISLFGFELGDQADLLADLEGRIRSLKDELKLLEFVSGPAVAFEIPQVDTAIKQQEQEAKRRRLEELAALEAIAEEIEAEQNKINESLTKQAADSAGVIGIERAISTLNEQKTLVDAAIQELIDSAITDPAELEIRLAQIRDQALGFFDEVEAAAQAVTIDFSGAGDLLSGFDQSFVDFLPGLSDLRDQFAELQIELAYTTDITAEQAAEFEYLSAAAAVASGDAVFLDDVVNQLGINFLATNETAALLVDQLYLAAAAYASGAITAEQYAGVTAALGSQLLALASEAGVATSAIHELIAAQGGLAGTSGFAVGQQQGAAIGQGIQARQAAVQRDRARRDAERAADRARRDAESAAKRAAREQESAAKRAARELEQGAKKAAQELQGALRNVPGLFSPTQATEQDFRLTEAGIYSDQADEYLRRLRDEVLNGTDWADVSIDEAKQALRDLGLRVADDNRIALQQFEEAWSNQVLFSDAANIDKFIDDEAVQRSLDLQEKAKQGQENIFKHFGAVVDDAVEAVVSGVSSGGGVSGSAATGYTVPISAQLIPASADLTSIPTLGGESFVIDVASIQGQLDTLVLPELTIDTTALDALTGTVTMTPELASDAQTVISNAVDALTAPKIPIGAKVDYSSLADALSFMGSQKVTILLRTGIYEQGFADTLETIGSTKQSIQITGVISSYGVAVEALGQLDTAGKAAADRLKQAIADNVGTTAWDEGGIVAPIADGLISAINTQVRGRTAGIQREGGNVGEILKSGIASSVSATAWEDGQIVAPIAQGLITAINTQVRGMTEGFQREGGNIAAIVMSGLANSWQQQDSGGNAGTGLAFGLLTELNRQLDATQNFFYAAGQTPAGNMIDGFSGAFTTKNADGSTRSTLVSGMLDSITQGIRINAENFQQRGVTVANYMQAGFTSQFGNETFKTNLVAAGELMAGYLKQGILQNLNGVADEIAAKVMDDISTGLEGPQ